MKTTAVILAAGKGKRMGTAVSKQYLMLEGYPILYYAIKAFENSSTDNIILVAGKGQEEYCRSSIVNNYGFKKVKAVVTGGKERYNSVHYGLKAIEELGIDTDIVLIHDGARPFVSEKIINDSIDCACEYKACVAAVKAKDTIKLSDGEGFVSSTPDRNMVWQIQTPQTFLYTLIKKAYDKAIDEKDDSITDDAMVFEKYGEYGVKLLEGSYDNIKITTREDLVFGQAVLANQKK